MSAPFKTKAEECEAMDALQDHGIISDNCVDWNDVSNRAEALAWLKLNFLTFNPKSSE